MSKLFRISKFFEISLKSLGIVVLFKMNHKSTISDNSLRSALKVNNALIFETGRSRGLDGGWSKRSRMNLKLYQIVF